MTERIDNHQVRPIAFPDIAAIFELEALGYSMAGLSHHHFRGKIPLLHISSSAGRACCTSGKPEGAAK